MSGEPTDTDRSDSIAIMWFRRDLRLADNPALIEAATHHRTILGLFVHDGRLRRPAGGPRLTFLEGCLRSLNQATGNALVFRVGDPGQVIPELAAEVKAAAVYCAADFGPYGSRRDTAVEGALSGLGIPFRRMASPYAVDPGTIANRQDEPYKVFTPFSKAWRVQGWPAPLPSPAVEWVSGIRSDPAPVVATTEAQLPDPGEAAAHRGLDQFLSGPVKTYADRRNRPDLDATSRLSPYLKWGCLHPRQILERLGNSEGERVLRTELCWREFYADVLHHRPDTAREAFNPAMRSMVVDTGDAADKRFEAWTEGLTGYPIVDAGMRQLRGEAWVHNRVRMIVASFLVKDLHLDWTRGAKLFMSRLVDGDLASNHHGWQWTAGTGTDAAPYFRVFNPVSQGRRFDPSGDYVRRWVPELRHIPGPDVHEPWKLSGDLFGAGTGSTYPDPIVDHATERTEALRRYSAVREG